MSTQPTNWAPYPLRVNVDEPRAPKWGDADYFVSDVDLKPCFLCGEGIHGQDYVRGNTTTGTVAHLVCAQAKREGMNRAQYEANAELQRQKNLGIYREYFAKQVETRLHSVPGGAWTVPGSVEFTEAVKSPKLIGFVNRWHEDQLSVLILGASGTGKSASVAALMRRMYGGLECRPPADDDESVAMAAKRYDWGILRSLLWTNGFEIANAKRYSPLGSEPAIIEKCKKASLLVVDEVGQESYDGTLFEIIEARYCNQAPTIVTSGLHREEFLAKYGSGMYRRLTEKPYATAINLWPSSKSLEVVK